MDLAEGAIETYMPSITELAAHCKEVWSSVKDHKKARLENQDQGGERARVETGKEMEGKGGKPSVVGRVKQCTLS